MSGAIRPRTAAAGSRSSARAWWHLLGIAPARPVSVVGVANLQRRRLPPLHSVFRLFCRQPKADGRLYEKRRIILPDITRRRRLLVGESVSLRECRPVDARADAPRSQGCCKMKRNPMDWISLAGNLLGCAALITILCPAVYRRRNQTSKKIAPILTRDPHWADNLL